MLHGFDISAYQSSTVLDTVPPVDFALVKATEGSGYTSSRFAAQYASAGRRARVRGAYHFARPEQSSATSQCARFLDVAQPKRGEIVMLDLEASRLSQAATNAWARAFGDELRDQAPGVRTVLYMGAGYASTTTGKGLAAHYDYWMYPQYPSAYQLSPTGPGIEERRATNRSSLEDGRTPIARATTQWPPAVTPWLPSGISATGWDRPHIWQFTDNYNGLDASVSWLTLDQLAGGGGPTPLEDDMLSGTIPAGKGGRDPILFPAGAFKTVSFGWDNTYTNTDLGITRQGPAQVRIAMHQKGRKGVVETVTVGAAPDDPKGWSDNVSVTLPSGCDRIDITRLDDGARPLGFCVA